MKHITNAIIMVLSFLTMTFANGFTDYVSEDWNQILNTLEVALPLLFFIGAPLIITLIIVGFFKLLKYTFQLGASFVPEKDNK